MLQKIVLVVVLLILSIGFINTAFAEIPIYTEGSTLGQYYTPFNYAYKMYPCDFTAKENDYWIPYWVDGGFNTFWTKNNDNSTGSNSLKFGGVGGSTFADLLNTYSDNISIIFRPDATTFEENNHTYYQSHTADWKSEAVSINDEAKVWDKGWFSRNQGENINTFKWGQSDSAGYPDVLDAEHWYIDPEEFDSIAFLIGDQSDEDARLNDQMTDTWLKKAMSTRDTITIYIKTYINTFENDIDDIHDGFPFLTMYSGVYDTDGYVPVDSSTVTWGTVEASSGLDDSKWYAFELLLVKGDMAFALKWRKPWYMDGQNKVYIDVGAGIRDIRYEGKAHEKIFEYVNAEYAVDTNSDYWHRFRDSFNDAIDGGYDSRPGIMGHEPWEYAYETTKKLTQAWMSSRPNVPLGLEIYHQFPMYGSQSGDNDIETNPMVKWLDNENGPGTAAIILDGFPISWNHWEYSYDGGEDDELSIQRAWDDLINVGDYGEEIDHRYDNNYFDNMGYRGAAEAAKFKDKEFWAGIQASGQLKNGGAKTGHGEPTPNDVKCQGFLAMSFDAKGFFYSYGAQEGKPKYNWPDPDVFTETSVAAREGSPADCDPVYFNGFTDTGLFTYWGDSDTINFEEIDDALEFHSARNGEYGIFYPNEKFGAAKEFNLYVAAVEGHYSNLYWSSSECVGGPLETRAGEDISFVKNIRTYPPNGLDGWDEVADDENDTYLQVGILDHPAETNNGSLRYFMLVNRRCYEEYDNDIPTEDSEHRRVTASIDFPPDPFMFNSVIEVASGEVVGSGFGDVDIQYDLPPGTGRLFMTIGGDVEPDGGGDVNLCGLAIIDDEIIIPSGYTLTVQPGTQIFITENGKITVNGTMRAVGKADSIIYINSFTSDKDGYIQLNGSGTDSLTYCDISNLKQGIKITKGSTSTAVISHCTIKECDDEGLYASGSGTLNIDHIDISECDGDGAYIYGLTTTIDSCTFNDNTDNGLYLYNVSSSSTVTNCEFMSNGTSEATSADGNVRLIGCSPTLQDNIIAYGNKYGIYGANYTYPIMYTSSSDSAKNTVSGNRDHETYWSSSYPMLDYGHNNFDTEDDTVLYVNDAALVQFYARGNYWGGSAPDTVGGTGQSLTFYNPSQTTSFYFNTYDSQTNHEAAQDILIEALDLEVEDPEEAMELYQRIIGRYGSSSAAPIAVERLFGLTKSFNDRGPVRMRELDNIERYFSTLVNSPYMGLAKKAKRTALWALAAQDRFDEAIEGFEDILDNADCLGDSVFAIIDLEALHLEAREWARRDTSNRVQSSSFGEKPEIAPANFTQHRKHTDELLALLDGTDAFRTRPIVPDEYFLAQNYPNPFNSTTKIQYGLPIATHVTIRIFDIMGREVATILNEPHQAGFYTHVWSGKNKYDVPVASGVYFYRIETPNFNKVKKMTLIK